MVKKWVKRGGRGGYPQKCQKVPFLGGSKGGKRGKKGGEGGVPSKTPTFGLKKGGGGGYLNNTLLADFCTNPFNMPLGGYCRK